MKNKDLKKLAQKVVELENNIDSEKEQEMYQLLSNLSIEDWYELDEYIMKNNLLKKVKNI